MAFSANQLIRHPTIASAGGPDNSVGGELPDSRRTSLKRRVWQSAATSDLIATALIYSLLILFGGNPMLCWLIRRYKAGWYRLPYDARKIHDQSLD